MVGALSACKELKSENRRIDSTSNFFIGGAFFCYIIVEKLLKEHLEVLKGGRKMFYRKGVQLIFRGINCSF
jgi:hypothetical protein